MTPLEIALKEYGTKEIGGLLHNPQVLKYFRDIGQTWVKDDETAWCAAFVNWCLKKAGRPYLNTLNARSFLNYGSMTKNPKLGDLVVLWRIKKGGPFGHAGFYITENANEFFLLGGNQANEVNISRYPKSQFLGFRSVV